MSRLTVFAKGNLDVRDTLHSQKIGNRVAWNGINEILRARAPPAVARVQHETWTRSDALLLSDGTVPPELARHAPTLDPYSAASQFSHALFATRADVIALSVHPDINTTLLRHKRDGYLFYPYQRQSWRKDALDWLQDNFEDIGLLDPETSMANLVRTISRIRQGSNPAILIYNVSSVVPGEKLHAYDGLDEALSTRIRRFNLGLIEVSRQTGISLIDVDRIVAEEGANRMKYDFRHLTSEGCRVVAEEVVRVLDDLGYLASATGDQ